MKQFPFRWLAALMPLVLGGCLLPQPDTPPIGPGRQVGAGTSQAAPITAPNSQAAAGATGTTNPPVAASTAPSTDQNTVRPSASPSTTEPTRLEVSLTGVAATSVGVIDTKIGQPTLSESPQGGSLEFQLEPGSYLFEVTTAQGTVRTTTPLVITGGGVRTVAIDVKASPLSVTLTENGQPVTPAPSASASGSPAPSASPSGASPSPSPSGH